MDYGKELFNYLYVEKLASVVVIFTRIIDTVLGIQSKITQSIKDLVKVSVEYSYQKFLRFIDKKPDEEDLENAIELSREFFFDNGKIWNILPDDKLYVFIREEIRKRNDIPEFLLFNK